MPLCRRINKSLSEEERKGISSESPSLKEQWTGRVKLCSRGGAGSAVRGGEELSTLLLPHLHSLEQTERFRASDVPVPGRASSQPQPVFQAVGVSPKENDARCV